MELTNRSFTEGSQANTAGRIRAEEATELELSYMGATKTIWQGGEQEAGLKYMEK